MRSDRYTKVVLTVIAVALCTLALPRLDTAEVMAASGQPGAMAGITQEQNLMPPMESVDPGSQRSRVPTSTLPLRWRVSWAAMVRGNYYTNCSTAIAVTNTTGSSVDVEVEWMAGGVSLALRPRSVLSYATTVWIPDGASAVNNVPWYAHDVASIVDFMGSALVTADDPRILVSAFQYCRSGIGYAGPTILSQTNIPAYPVGATAEYFVAGMPATWTPPKAAPETAE